MDSQSHVERKVEEVRDNAPKEERVIITEVSEFPTEEVAEPIADVLEHKPIIAIVSGDATLVSAALHERYISRPSISEEVAQVLLDTQTEKIQKLPESL